MKWFLPTVALATVLLAQPLLEPASAGEPATMVILNGTSVPVFFNDGDSFRVLGGSMKGAKARIAGFNTLESHGPVHSWGDWTTKEMYVLAKMATLHARRGKWTCKTDGKTDTYGRMLTFCPGLGKSLIERGLAHAMTVTDEPGRKEFLDAQREAMQARRGIWAHGIPPFVLTSLHSAEEDVSGRGTYNRLVSTADGHSVKWKHENHYKECDNVCHYIYDVDEARVDAVAAYLKADSPLAKMLGSLPEDKLQSMVLDYARYRHVNRVIPKKKRQKVKKVLDKLASEGQFGKQSRKKGSCMVHVPFERRFGGTRAECLR
jgi:endonuclease YncB( thermonuclease family)